MSSSSPVRPFLISQESWPVYQTLVEQPMAAPFLLKALRGIQQDPGGCGRPVRGGPLRCDVVALPGDKQLWLYWNPTVDPTVVVLALFPPDPGSAAG